MARVLLGVTGGIAAYKACELCRLFVKDGHEVVPLVTPGAQRFVTEETFRAAMAALRTSNTLLQGKTVLISAGGTREPMDAVRYVGNRSSGRMGVALAAEARRRGADVTLLAANLAVPAPEGVELVETPTAADLQREALARAAEVDAVVMAAAVAVYRPAEAFK